MEWTQDQIEIIEVSIHGTASAATLERMRQSALDDASMRFQERELRYRELEAEHGALTSLHAQNTDAWMEREPAKPELPILPETADTDAEATFHASARIVQNTVMELYKLRFNAWLDAKPTPPTLPPEPALETEAEAMSHKIACLQAGLDRTKAA